MPERRLERRLMDRLQGQLDAWQPPRPDPAQARYRELARRPGGGLAGLKGLGLGFAAGAAATIGVLILLTGSAQPQVWLDRAQGSVRHLEEDIVESRQPAASPQPTAADQPSPPSTRAGSPTANGTGQLPALPNSVSTVSDQHEDQSGSGGGSSGPSTQPTPAPPPSSGDGDGSSGSSGGHDGGTSAPQPSPSPTSSDGSSDGSSGHR
jgi:hypothetical protein